MAVNVTVNNGGGGDYTTLDAALIDVRDNGTNTGNTITITDSFQGYIASAFMGGNQRDLVLSASATDPSNFPAVKHTTNDGFSWHSVSNVTYRNLIINNGSVRIDLGQGPVTTCFDSCVFFDYSSTAVRFSSGTSGNRLEFYNCLVANNNSGLGSNGILEYNPFGAGVELEIQNLETDGDNYDFFTQDPSVNLSNTFIRNGTLWHGGTTGGVFRGNNLRARCFNSVSFEAVTNYGIGCSQTTEAAINYVGGTGARNTVSAYKKTTGSSAEGVGDSGNQPTVDIEDTSRSGTSDAGIYVIVGGGGGGRRRMFLVS